MKKTLSVNLSGSIYHIDEDAYQMLMEYLQDVKKHLAASLADEVLNDIEQRIGELFAQWMQNKRQVVIVSDVERVIDVLGRPEQFDNGESEEDAENTASDTSENASQKYEERLFSSHRKLYRDPEFAFLGGVCSGLAAYLNVSIVLMRLVMFLVIWISAGTGLLFYLIAWIIIPEARTSAQRLEMRGEDVTIENIEKKVREEATKVKDRVDGYVKSNRFHEHSHSLANGFVSVIRVFVKVLMAIIGGSLGLVGFFVILALMFALIAIWTGNIHFLQPWPYELEPLHQALMNPSSATWMTLGLLLVVGIPFLGLFRLLFRSSFNLKPAARWEMWASMIFWFVGIGICFFAGLKLLSYYNGFWI